MDFFTNSQHYFRNKYLLYKQRENEYFKLKKLKLDRRQVYALKTADAFYEVVTPSIIISYATLFMLKAARIKDSKKSAKLFLVFALTAPFIYVGANLLSQHMYWPIIKPVIAQKRLEIRESMKRESDMGWLREYEFVADMLAEAESKNKLEDEEEDEEALEDFKDTPESFFSQLKRIATYFSEK